MTTCRYLIGGRRTTGARGVTDALVLFAGAGGSTVGLEAAGLSCIGVENWSTAVATHRDNAGACLALDLSDPAVDDLFAAHHYEVPVLWASSPCQPFSAAGNQNGEFDDRDGFPWLLRIVERLRPWVVITENVKGLTFVKHAAYFGSILERLHRLGYVVDWRVLNTADYGVPQSRERCIVVARRDGRQPRWPDTTHTEAAGMFTERWVSMADALGWGEELAWHYNRGAGLIEHHGPRRDYPFAEPSPTITSHAYKDMKVVLNTRRGHTADGDTQTRPVDGPAPAVTGGRDQQWVWERPASGAIRVTLEELATLQGFPPGYRFHGNRTEQARQIGNAVPPRLAQVIAGANRPALDQEPAA